ncbi:MAG TPA: ribbon-helix-helix protein, CopG family [Patescibacteria group bacterium]|nr:ribbon-helix-helix protein, CopG family [Patescibacteria group bacterium]
MARVNVFLKDDLLKAIDAEAADTRTRRSALIQRALLEYLEARRREREASVIRREMEEAGREMDVLAERLGSWDPVKTIRDMRDSRAQRVREPGKRSRGGKRAAKGSGRP